MMAALIPTLGRTPVLAVLIRMVPKGPAPHVIPVIASAKSRPVNRKPVASVTLVRIIRRKKFTKSPSTAFSIVPLRTSWTWITRNGSLVRTTTMHRPVRPAIWVRRLTSPWLTMSVPASPGTCAHRFPNGPRTGKRSWKICRMFAQHVMALHL